MSYQDASGTVEFHVPAVPAGAKLAGLHTSRLAGATKRLGDQ